MIDLLYAKNKFNDINAIVGPESQYYAFESEYKGFHVWDSFTFYIEADTIDSLATAQKVTDYSTDYLCEEYFFDKDEFWDYLKDRGENFDVKLS